MGIPHYLAMTAAELCRFEPPLRPAWLACHFSPYHSGLSNLPAFLAPGSLLILDDSTPIENHDPETVKNQLIQCVETWQCSGILMDFQRPVQPEAQEMAAYLSDSLPCPAAVSHLYAKELDCPVFLPPAPLHSSLESHLSPWESRDIWLETALDSETLVLTEDGCRIYSTAETPEAGFVDEKLHCHYWTQVLPNEARFTLWRTREDLEGLLAEAEALGVTAAVGLWQELCFAM